LGTFIDEVKRTANIVSLLASLQYKDEYTFQHTVQIGILAAVLGQWLGMDEHESNKLAIAGTLHDIGKCRIPLKILNKPGPLSEEEFDLMKLHSIYGYKILSRSGGYDNDILQAVLQHHERMDGSGYPDGIKKEDINYFAKIIAVVDIYHAMTTTRVYRKKKCPYIVLEHLKKSINGLDSGIVLKFIDNMINMLRENKVRLSNDSVGDVIYVDKECLSRPIVKVCDSNLIIDLKEKKNIEIVDLIYS
jgi:HD-GYP domain-containing protein (c-di-GMP phosphodiesterase class II)